MNLDDIKKAFKKLVDAWSFAIEEVKKAIDKLAKLLKVNEQPVIVPRTYDCNKKRYSSVKYGNIKHNYCYIPSQNKNYKHQNR